MRWRVEVIGWLNLCFVLFLFLFFVFFCLQHVHQSFFFICIVRIYVLSLLFLVYSVHINHFFLSYCKNLYTFFVFFCLRCAHQSFFSSISYCKNLCTFFRIRISVLIVLESILICFIRYFYNTKGKNMTYTHTKLLWSKKYWRIRICVLFLIFKHLSLSLSSISAMPLPQINCHFFFSFYLSNAIATN